MKNNKLQKNNSIILEDRICQLVSSAKLFNEQTEKINKLYKSYNGNKLLCIQSALHFEYVLSVFKTLFEISQRPEEQSFAFWRKLKEEESKEMQDFQKIKELYKKSSLKKFRNKITDHKDVKNAGDAVANFYGIVRDEHVKSASEIIEKLEKHIRNYFTEPNLHCFYNFYCESMNDLIVLLDKQNEK